MFGFRRGDDLKESLPFGLGMPAVESGNGSQFATQADFAEGDHGRRESLARKSGGDRQHNRRVSGRFFYSITSGHVDVDVVGLGLDAQSFGQDGQKHLQPVRIEAGSLALRITETRSAGQSLNLDQDRARAFGS